jgi:hypothetical protein
MHAAQAFALTVHFRTCHSHLTFTLFHSLLFHLARHRSCSRNQQRTAWSASPTTPTRARFPAIIPTQERIVRVDVRDGETLGAGFLLYFHEGLVLCSLVPGQALHQAGAINIGDVIIGVNGVSLACETMDDALSTIRDSLPEVEFVVSGRIDLDEIHLLEVLEEDDERYDASPDSLRARGNGVTGNGGSAGLVAYPDYSRYASEQPQSAAHKCQRVFLVVVLLPFVIGTLGRIASLIISSSLLTSHPTYTHLHTHGTHTHTHTHTQSLTLAHAHSFTHSLIHTHTHTHTLSRLPCDS